MNQHNNNQLNLSTKRAQAIVSMGLIKRTGNCFEVGTASIKNKSTTYQVWRNALNQVCCTCPTFTQASAANPSFRCEHILAVKLSLTLSASNTTTSTTTSQPSDSDKDHKNAMPHIPQSPAPNPSNHQPEEKIIHPQPTNHHQSPIQIPTTFREVAKQSSVPILIESLKQPKEQATHLEVMEWHTMADHLDQAAPDWSFTVRTITPIGQWVAVTAAITIGGTTREGIGTGLADSETGIKKAEHEALKQAAIKFSFVRDIYPSTATTHITQTASSPTKPHDPLAKTLDTLVTPKQLAAIRTLAQAQGLQAEQECQTIYGCQLEELSRQAAATLIDQFKSRPGAEPQSQWRRTG